MSAYSPGTVSGEEILSRFLFDSHLNAAGKVKGSAYSHAFSRGCSIQREGIAEDNEIANWLREFLEKNAARSWRGVAQAPCQSIRDLRLMGSAERLFCVYDTAEFSSNPAHGEICVARPLNDEGEQNEARKLIRDAFGGDTYGVPPAYRNGNIASAL